MQEEKQRYIIMEKIISAVLIFNTLLFCVYLYGAGCGIGWLKVLTAIIACLLSVLCLAFLFMTKEISRHRSLWMTLGASAIIFLIVLSLLLGYPSPAPQSIIAV